jgi:hypothetical protein
VHAERTGLGVPTFVTRPILSMGLRLDAPHACDAVWLVFAPSQAPDPIPPEDSSSWDWLLPVGIALAVVAALGRVAIHLVRSRRLATQALFEVRGLRSSVGESGQVS